MAQRVAAPRWALRPLLAEFVQASLCQVWRGHHNVKLAIRVEQQEPWFRKRGNLGRIVHLDDHNRPASALVFREVDRLRLQLVEDALYFLSYGAVPDGSIESFVRDLDVKKHSHVFSPSINRR
jgi:hypothetical protein